MIAESDKTWTRCAQPGRATKLLMRWNRGDREALRQLMPVVYAELRQLAGRCFPRRRPNHTLQPTELVHEVFLRLVKQDHVELRDRSHLFAVAAIAMRQILINHAKKQQRLKRGGGVRPVALEETALAIEPTSAAEEIDLPALDNALKKLAAFDERKARVAELRFFFGLSVEQTAEALDVSCATIKRDWSLARVWLLREIQKEGGDGR